MIKVEQVSKKFGNHLAVADISFTVVAGETLVLLGSSGCGKTTTLKMLNRLIEPSSGKIWIDGKDISTQSPEELRRSIGYVIQHIGLFPHYTVEENISLVPHLLNWAAPIIKERTYQMLETLGLSPTLFAKRYPHELSGGQQQRVGLARALAANPPIILMDEPFGALDPIIRHNIRQEFLNLDELKDKTTILVTHDVTEAVQLGDRICLMDQGKIQQIGTAKELLLTPVNTFVRDFFSHNRFQLELMVHTLEDVLLKLKPGNKHVANAPIFKSSHTLWDVINQIHEKSSEERWIGIQKDSTIHYITLEEILNNYINKNYSSEHLSPI